MSRSAFIKLTLVLAALKTSNAAAIEACKTDLDKTYALKPAQSDNTLTVTLNADQPKDQTTLQAISFLETNTKMLATVNILNGITDETLKKTVAFDIKQICFKPGPPKKYYLEIEHYYLLSTISILIKKNTQHAKHFWYIVRGSLNAVFALAASGKTPVGVEMSHFGINADYTKVRLIQVADVKAGVDPLEVAKFVDKLHAFMKAKYLLFFVMDTAVEYLEEELSTLSAELKKSNAQANILNLASFKALNAHIKTIEENNFDDRIRV